MALAELAGQQHGVVARRQLEELGFVRTTIDHWANDGRLHRLHRGVYAVGHPAVSWEGRCLAAVLARPGAVASHKTAGWVHGLLRSRPGTIHLTAPNRQRLRRDFKVHFARLVPEDSVVVDGIPVTSPARTVLDLAAGRKVAGSNGSSSAATTTKCSTAGRSRRCSAAPAATTVTAD